MERALYMYANDVAQALGWPCCNTAFWNWAHTFRASDYAPGGFLNVRKLPEEARKTLGVM
ncbi:MAG: hypothetical protein CML68_08710 [Rhodobacteraceae bacterium]|nr:hypothetical protein [Paracoccaceae bacterium]